MPAIKSQFPIFQHHPDLVYLDNAATTQKPQSVLDAMNDFYTKHYANVHRGIYQLSEEATELYENARRIVAKFINAEPEEVVFTYGTTDGINMLAQSLVKSRLISPTPQVVLTELEHHANILPWQQIAEERVLKYLETTPDFKLKLTGPNNESYIEELLSDVGPSPDVVAVTALSNVTGTIPDIDKVLNLFSQGYSVVDAAQAAAHMPIDVKAMGVDFLVMSGHKMYGPTGVGVLYGRRELLEKMSPARVGGGMITKVDKDNAQWAPVPEKFEAGTPPIAEVIGLAAAVEFINSVGWEQIQHHEQELRQYAITQLQSIPELTLYHPPATEVHGGVFSFSVEGVHPHDLSQVLAGHNVAVRAGHHCAQIFHRDVLHIPASTRASIGIYNTTEGIDRLINAIESAITELT